MTTAGCERLGIEVPIIQAPLGGVGGPALAAAVSNAGGLGTLPLWGADIEALRQQVRETRALTAKPFAVNLNLDFPQEERLDACLQEGVPVISFFWRDPSALVARAKSAGAIVLHTVSTAAEARHAVECGVDVVIAQGWEAGGHVRGMVATMPLIPAVVDAVGPIPVIAAGVLPMVVGLRQPWHSALRGRGSGPVFLQATRRRFIRTIAREFCRQRKTIQFISKNCSTSAGGRHPIAYCAIVLSLPGKPPDARQRACGPVRVMS